MKAKKITVVSTSESIYVKDAAAYINRFVSEAIGSTAFNDDDASVIAEAFEAEIASCDPDFIPYLKIKIEEVDVEDVEIENEE